MRSTPNHIQKIILYDRKHKHRIIITESHTKKPNTKRITSQSSSSEVLALGHHQSPWKIVYSIFALYRDTKIIHSIMMIWLVIFIISNYSLASSPPKDPGGVKKNIFSESRTLIHRIFSVSKTIRPVSKRVVFVFSFFVLYLPQEIVYFLAKRKKKR